MINNLLFQILPNFDYLLKVQFTSQMIIFTVVICLTPTIADRLTKKQSRAARVGLETLLFVIFILGFSVWLFGTPILGFWIIPTTIFILILEVGSHVVEHYKISTLNRLADEVTFKKLKNQAEDIERMFRIGLTLYIPIPLSLIIGTVASWFYKQTPKETILFSLKLVILMVSLFLVIFLYISFIKICDPLFHDGNISSVDLDKETKGFGQMLVKIYRLVVPRQFREDSEKEAIELACTVSYLRKIYLYDAIHNVFLLVALVALITFLFGVNIRPIWLFTSLVVAVTFLNVLPYVIGQTALHNKILERYKGIKRIKLLKKLREYSPLFPFLSLQPASSYSPYVKLGNFMLNQKWNSTLREIINLLEKMSENNSSKYDLRDSTIYGFAPETEGSPLVIGKNIQNNEIAGTKNIYQSEQNLAKAAAEIQKLLKQLEQNNPTTTFEEKATVAAKAIKQIENNPTLKARVVGALKFAGKEAFKEAVDHPLVNILMAGIEGWQEKN
ncbi:MAG: fatty acid desaturase [Dolichospermum sp. LBC05a]|nr:hypothetical protein [Dolichospermum sp. OL01]MCO5798329.1 hypothetical protein [Dolichospermum sp. OL03]MCS6283621.1 hypothetical protein [Dolichospermum sp.]QSV59774.1 MAG: fatty acid desaturase [Dolichospermum sp. LBC05a]